MFGRDGYKAGADASILIADGAEHVFEGEQASCLLFIFQLHQLRVEVGLNGSGLIKCEICAVLFNQPLGDVGYVLVVAVTVTG